MRGHAVGPGGPWSSAHCPRFLFLAGDSLIFGPTPTPTSTLRPPATPTRNAMATRARGHAHPGRALADAVGIDIGRGTRVAMVTPTPAVTQTVDAPGVTPTSVSNLPIVVRPGDEPTAVPIETATLTATPTETETPTPTATDTATPVQLATTVPTVPSLTTATPSPTPTPTVYTRSNILARVISADTAAYEGPSTISAVSGNFPNDRDISLQGRTESGEWVAACCAGNSDVRWLRAAQVDIVTLTPTPTGLPTEVVDTYETVRWLPLRQPDSNVEPLPVPTAALPGTYPVFRYERSGRGVIPAVPQALDVGSWSAYPAGSAFTSGAVASEDTVVAANVDPRLYGVNRQSGSQTFRADLATTSRVAPALHDGLYYVVDQGGRLYQFSQATALWTQDTGVVPSETMSLGINLGADYLYFTGTGSAQQRVLLMVRRSDHAIVQRFETQGSELTYPVIGDQLVYVGGTRVWALDLYNVSRQVWVYEQGLNDVVSAPPAYVTPGRRALAELYVGERDGELHIIDANTGRHLQSLFTGQEITGIAVDNEQIYVTTVSGLSVYRLYDLSFNWSVTFTSRPLGGPLVDGQRVFVALSEGIIHVYAAAIGGNLSTIATAAMAGAPVVSGTDVYIPSVDGNMYNWRGVIP
ncbi:MAG: PQQ-binding-like beta-propeller repeat protein [Caldilineaceae bacterium]